ncbi:MAG: tetratricopeptide repeat protein [Planctomycetota bacterium]
MRGRQPLVFLAALVVTAGLSAWDLSSRYEAQRAPSAVVAQAESLPAPPSVVLGALADAPSSQRQESVFAPPRELLPLDPLELPTPPLPPLSVLRPAVQPALQGVHAHVYRLPAAELGDLGLLGAALESAEPVEEAEPVAPVAAASTAAAATNGKQRHDWIVRSNRTRLTGTILNANALALASRPGEDLKFQQVSEKTGGPLGLPFVVPRADVVEFGFAETFENTYRLRSATLGSGAGAVASRRALALELLEQAESESRALEFAEEEARRAHTGAPTDAAACRLLATVLRRRHDIEGELALYAAARSAGLTDPALVAAHGELLRRLGLRERAEELLNEARTLGRQTAEVALLAGRLQAQAGRWESALIALQEAESLPFLGPLEIQQKQELLLEIASALIALGRPDAALRETQRVLVDEPSHAQALVVHGAAQAARGDLPAASASFAAALAAAPGDSRALTNAGLVSWLAGDGERALRLLRQAQQADPYRAVAPTLALGVLFEDAAQPEAAREAYAQALVLEPGHVEALYRLGRSQRLDGDADGAVSTLSEALRLGGSWVQVLLELGRASLELWPKDPAMLRDFALRYLREAERLEPENGEVHWSLGLTALIAGETLACRTPLLAAVKSGLAGAHVGLGVAHYRSGDAKTALQHFDEVAKAYAGQPSDPQAVYAAEQAARIRDNLSKRQWLERFGRSTLQRGWTERVWEGSPQVFLDGGRLRIEGRMERSREDDRPGITRPVDGKGFYGVQAEISQGEFGEGRVGLALTLSSQKGAQGRLPKARLEIFLDEVGQLRLSALDNFDTQLLAAAPVPGALVARGEAALVGIERLDDKSGRFQFTLAGRPLGAPVEIRSLRDLRSPLDLALFADAAPGATVSASIALVRIVQAP